MAGPSASGGIGSSVPPVVAPMRALALMFAMLVLGRLSLDLAPWRSTVFASRLEHPD